LSLLQGRLRQELGREPAQAASSLAVARETGPVPVRAVRHGRVWTDDFLKDLCANGQAILILSLVDDFARKCLGIENGGSLGAWRAIAILDRAFAEQGRPM
jgi:hypothetical protein